MAEYLLFSYQPHDWTGTDEEMREAYSMWQQYLQDLKDAGVFVDNRGLAATDMATTVRVRDGETQLTDGPFAETKEYLAGYFLVDVADLDAALHWAARMPGALHGSVEVRPVWG